MIGCEALLILFCWVRGLLHPSELPSFGRGQSFGNSRSFRVFLTGLSGRTWSTSPWGWSCPAQGGPCVCLPSILPVMSAHPQRPCRPPSLLLCPQIPPPALPGPSAAPPTQAVAGLAGCPWDPLPRSPTGGRRECAGPFSSGGGGVRAAADPAEPHVQGPHSPRAGTGGSGHREAAAPPQPRRPGPGRRPPAGAPPAAPRPARSGPTACRRQRAIATASERRGAAVTEGAVSA